MKATYLQFQPSLQCRPFLDAIWIQESAADALAPPTTLLPNGRMELVIHYGDRFAQVEHGISTLLSSNHIVGQRDHPVAVKASGNTGIVIARFCPWAAASLFDIPLAEFRNQVVSLDRIWPLASINRLLEQVHAATSPLERADVVDRFIVEMSTGGSTDNTCRAAIEIMNASWGSQSIDSLAALLGLSRRQFSRRFLKHTGISPKRMSRLLRAQKAVTCLRSGWHAHDIVVRCNFSDQSHLIHEVVAHTGKRPSQLHKHVDTNLQRYYNIYATGEFCGQSYL